MDESHESLLRADSNGGSDTGESSEAQDSDADAGSCRICKVGALLLALLLLCLAAAATAFRAPLAAYLARRGIAAAQLEIFSVDLGHIAAPLEDPQLLLSPQLRGRLRRPSPVEAEIRMSQLILYMPTPHETLQLGQLHMPDIYVQANRDWWMNLTARVVIENLTALGLAGKHVVQESQSSWMVRGQLAVRCHVLGFLVQLSNISFEKLVDLKGIAGFAQDVSPITMQKVTKAEGHAHHLDTTVLINVINPSYLAADLEGPFHFNVTQRGFFLGTASLPSVSLRPGRMTLAVHFVLAAEGGATAQEQAALGAFLTGYIGAQVQRVSMLGSSRSSANPVAAVVLDGLQLTFRFQPPEASFIHHINADVGLVGLQVTSEVVNPLPQVIVLNSMDLSIRERDITGENIFHLKGNATSGLGGQRLPPGASRFHLSLSTLDANLKDLLLIGRLIEDAVDGALVVGVLGPLSITIRPDFNLTVQYAANGVTAKLSCLVVCGSAHSVLNPGTWFRTPES